MSSSVDLEVRVTAVKKGARAAIEATLAGEGLREDLEDLSTDTELCLRTRYPVVISSGAYLPHLCAKLRALAVGEVTLSPWIATRGTRGSVR